MKNTLNQWEITIFKWIPSKYGQPIVQPKQLVIEGEKLKPKSMTKWEIEQKNETERNRFVSKLLRAQWEWSVHAL